jgi:YidC/Oxa1 family membrane protein insertase
VFASVLDPLYRLMAAILAAIYSVIPNYAVAIFGLTCIVLAILTPLTLKGLRSTIKIQKLMPEQKRLQAQFKDDRQALNEAIMAMYKENKVSPVGGCLPFLVQSPFFIALFGVLQGMSRVKYWVPNGRFAESAATGKIDGKAPQDAVAVGLPKHLSHESSLYKSLFGTERLVPESGLTELKHAPGEVRALGFDLARSASEMAKEGFVKFFPYALLIVLMVGLQVFAQRQVNRRNPAAAAANPQMQTITKVMPFMFGIFGWGFQAGLTLYWTTSSALRIVQQWALYRFDPTLAESVKEKRAELGRDAGKPSGKTKDKPPAPKADGGKVKGQKPAKAADDGAPPAEDKKSPGTAKPPKGTPRPAPKPKLGPPPRPAAGGPKGGANGSNGSVSPLPRPNPGRQQPKKRRKGR